MSWNSAPQKAGHHSCPSVQGRCAATARICISLSRGLPKLAGFDKRCVMRLEKRELLGWVCAQIHLGRLDTGMTKPERHNLADITGGLQGVHGAAVPQHMWGHMFLRQSTASNVGPSPHAASADTQSIPCHSSPITVQEHLWTYLTGRTASPRVNGALRLFPRAAALAPRRPLPRIRTLENDPLGNRSSEPRVVR